MPSLIPAIKQVTLKWVANESGTSVGQETGLLEETLAWPRKLAEHLQRSPFLWP